MTRSVQSSSRMPWLDNVKMVALLCVIIGHTTHLFANGLPGRMMGFIVAFNMPLFVLLAGYTSYKALSRLDDYKSIVSSAEKVLWRLVIPGVCLSAFAQANAGLLFARRLWMLFFAGVLLLYAISKVKETGKNIFLCFGLSAAKIITIGFLLMASAKLNMYWFLTMLMQIQLTFYIGFYIGKFLFPPFLNILFSGVILCIIAYYLFGSWTFEMTSYFIIGLVMKHQGWFERLFTTSFFHCSIMLVLGVILLRTFTIDYGFYAFGFDRLLSDGIIWVYVIRQIVALLFSFVIIRLVYAMSADYNWVSKMGKCSLAYYTIHVLILEMWLKPNLFFENTNSYMWLCCLMAACALTCITYIFIGICEQWRVTRCLVLGEYNNCIIK